MKKWLFTFLAAVVLIGCSNNNIDTAKVRAAMQSIDPAGKEQLELALTAIDAGKYGDAAFPLKKIAFGSKLDKDQIKVLKDTMAKVQAKIAKGQ
jgi:hypothetical protein